MRSVVPAGDPIVLPRITIEKAAPAPVLQPPVNVAGTANSNAAPVPVKSIVITSKKAEADEPLDLANHDAFFAAGNGGDNILARRILKGFRVAWCYAVAAPRSARIAERPYLFPHAKS